MKKFLSLFLCLTCVLTFSTLSQSRSRKSRQKKKPSTPMHVIPRTRAILRFPSRTSRRTPTSRTPNPSDFKAAFAAVHIQMKTDWRERLFQF